MIDSHVHLYLIERDEQKENELIEEIKHRGIEAVFNIGVNVESSMRVVNSAIANKGFVYGVVGLCPHIAYEFTQDDREKIKDIVLKYREYIYAIGEIGLDYYHGSEFKDIQKDLFEWEIELALENNLPVVIHSRDAKDDTYDILKQFAGKTTIIFHCYGYDRDFAMKLIEWDRLYISFAGNLTYKKAHNLHETAKSLPISRILLETDSPYLTPQAKRGKKNMPWYIGYTLDFFASLRGMDRAFVEDKIKANIVEAFSV